MRVTDEHCSRCGRVNCDEVPPGYWERLGELLKNAPEVTEDYEGEEVEPLL